jgi:hypothetical protein
MIRRLMPATYYIYPRRRVAVLTWRTQTPDLLQWQDILAALLADAAFGHEFGVVSDWRAVREPPSREFVQQAMEYASTVPPMAGVRWAAVMPAGAASAAGDPAGATALAGGFSYRVFTDFDRAVGWAGRTDAADKAPGAPQGRLASAVDVDALLDEAIGHLDEILNVHAVRFVALDRPALIERMERVRESSLAARIILAERRSLRGD